jgi:hypothetical protein
VLTQQAHHHPDALYAAKLSVTKLLFQHRWKPRRIMVLFDVINWMMVLPESHQRRYWQAVLRLKKEHEMKLLNPLEQMFFDDGVKSGLKQGLEQGLEQVWSRGWSWAHGRGSCAAGALADAALRTAAANGAEKAGQGQRGASGSLERCAGRGANVEAGF